MIRKGIRCAVRLKHKKCVKWELSNFLNLKRDRPDLELVSYLLRKDEDTYRLLLVIRSLEGKEIGDELEEEIRDFLYNHELVRAFKPNLPRPHKHQLSFLMLIEDTEVPGTIRVVTKQGGWFDSTIGTSIHKGSEHITFFAKDTQMLADVVEQFARHRSVFEFQGVDVGSRYESLADFVNDPYYLITVLTGSKGRQTILEKIKNSSKDLLDKIRDHAWWLIPLLKEILRWASRRGGVPSPEYRV